MQGPCLPVLPMENHCILNLSPSPQGPHFTHDAISSAPGPNLTLSITQAQDSAWASKAMGVVSRAFNYGAMSGFGNF